MVVDPFSVERISDDYLRDRPHEFTSGSAMDQATLKEGATRLGEHVGSGEEICVSPGHLGILRRCVGSKIRWLPLHEEHDSGDLAGKGRVNELAPEDKAWLRYNDEGLVELAALALVQRERIGQFEHHPPRHHQSHLASRRT